MLTIKIVYRSKFTTTKKSLKNHRSFQQQKKAHTPTSHEMILTQKIIYSLLYKFTQLIKTKLSDADLCVLNTKDVCGCLNSHTI